MVVAIHQPNFLPWLGYFHKIQQADVFVFLDDVQFSKGSFTNRNKIKTRDGVRWLTLPVEQRFGQKINECKIHERERSVKRVLKMIRHNYNESRYFDWYYPELEEIMMRREYNNLASLNIDLIYWAMDVLELHTKLYVSGVLGYDGEKNERIIKICRHFNADTYITGIGGIKYNDEGQFRDNGIELRLSDFEHPRYEQLYGDFEPNLSVIDYIFNNG